MCLRYLNIKCFVLLLTFVLTTLVSVPGFAWCIGEDGHFEIEYEAIKGCGIGAIGSTVDPVDGSSVHIKEDNRGACLDIYLQSGEAISNKRLYEKVIKTADTLALSAPPLFTSQAVKMVIANLVPRPPQRITQAVLDHRTIVLLI